jgi:hypothetical protein
VALLPLERAHGQEPRAVAQAMPLPERAARLRIGPEPPRVHALVDHAARGAVHEGRGGERLALSNVRKEDRQPDPPIGESHRQIARRRRRAHVVAIDERERPAERRERAEPQVARLVGDQDVRLELAQRAPEEPRFREAAVPDRELADRGAPRRELRRHRRSGGQDLHRVPPSDQAPGDVHEARARAAPPPRGREQRYAHPSPLPLPRTFTVRASSCPARREPAYPAARSDCACCMGS